MKQAQLSLSDLQYLIKDTLEDSFPEAYWVKAEISEITVNRSGHCYLDLVETDAANNVIARTRATIWSYTFRMLKPYFESTTGQLFAEGIKVLLNAKIEFHEVYGLSLNIRDIDPTYTMGDMARKRLEIIKQLEEYGVIEMNKELDLPIVPQKVAIISSPTAAGLQDFLDQLHNNQHQIKFYAKLFPAVMQGKDAPQSIMQALDLVFEYEDFFDVVVIIRGGGAQVDLAAFDHYELAFHVTQFPLPVITGIGHDKDDSVVDLVAHTRMKTPTAVAEFLISGAAEFLSYLNDLEHQFVDTVKDLLGDENEKLNDYVDDLQQLVRSQLKDKQQKLDILGLKINSGVEHFLKDQKNSLASQSVEFGNAVSSFVQRQNNGLEMYAQRLKMEMRTSGKRKLANLEILQNTLKYKVEDKLKFENQRLKRLTQNLRLVDPQNILQRGYSLTYKEGKIIKSVKELQKGDVIETQMSDGIISSKIEKK